MKKTGKSLVFVTWEKLSYKKGNKLQLLIEKLYICLYIFEMIRKNFYVYDFAVHYEIYAHCFPNAYMLIVL